MKYLILLPSFFFYSLKISQAQPGTPDASFGSNGFVRTEVAGGYNHNSSASQVLLQPGGNMYIIFETNGKFFVAKRLNNGSADLSYGNSGFSKPIDVAFYHAALQPDGKVVVAGYRTTGPSLDFALARFNTNGSPDSTFGVYGIQIIGLGVSSMAIQSDEKIVVALAEGYGFTVARFNTDGSPDNTFDSDGQQTTDFGGNASTSSVAIQSDGKIVVAGSAFTGETYDFAVARYNTDGSLDNSFSGDGKQTTNLSVDNLNLGSEDMAQSMAIQNNGKIVVAGYTNHINDPTKTEFDFAFARYNTNGTLDIVQIADFNNKVDYTRSSAISNDGKIVVAGDTYTSVTINFGLIRYNPNGNLDSTFGDNGKLITDLSTTTNSDDNLSAIAIQSDGKIVAAGHTSETLGIYDLIVVRYNTDGSFDNSFDGDGKLTDIQQHGNTIFKSTAIQKDGKILAAGYSWNGSNYDFAIARYNTDGSLDNSFSADGKQTTDFGSNDIANSITLQSDGKIVVAGSALIGEAYDFAVARYNTDGTPDSSFSGDGMQITDLDSDDFANSAAIQTNGKIVVAGSSSSSGSFSLLRYNSDGSLDKTFNGNGKAVFHFSNLDHAKKVAIQSDGKIVVVGDINSDFAIVRFNIDGTPDKTFSEDGKQTTDFYHDFESASSLVIQSDGKFVVTGFTNLPREVGVFALARYNTDGSIDKTFDGDGKTTTFSSESFAYDAVLQNDGKIVVAGTFLNGSKYDFALARYNIDGSPDNSFSEDGKQTIQVSAGNDFIYGIAIESNKLYVAGYGQYPDNFGVVARYFLNESVTLSCPSSKIASTDKRRCDAVVNNIDPVLQGRNTQINYILSGATVASGTGSVSGKRFNKGMTTVTYSAANDASKKCSFIVTVKDKKNPSITNVAAHPKSLWPPNHKMHKVTIRYNVKDNCGFNSPVLSVSSNETRENNDWIVIDNHHVQLRAERGKRGAERIYTITISVTDLSGNKSIKTINISVSKNKTKAKSHAANRSITIDEENIQNLIVKATPNPSQNYFIVLTKSNSNKPINLRVIDVLGRIVETRLNIAVNGQFQLGNNYQPGIYLVEVAQGTERQLMKLVKQ